ncbi:glycosyltransferase [Streptococcus iniae]|uniref:glycosyltransferase family 2 protein n=1 Tax=Streptococcus iniae TaxID=1346 RepID=UPI000EF6C6A6|nr:glycosyltransferase family 2 protein [Streptococcus iniae]RLU28308.1 glycosyltransferase [Streptococcus iniae]RLU30489.1 glycosyltransferase [Streptococcus iniae]RLV32565.1 glycosyltransferase [Streptococcus iniae]
MALLSIIVPCYNEEETIYPYLDEMRLLENAMISQLAFEYIFIDDGSTDNTLSILRELSSRFGNLHYLSFSRNFGKEAGLLAGLEEAKGDFITVMDVDLQDPPDLLPLMYAKILEGYDVVGTRRISRKGEPLVRSFCSKLFYSLINRMSKTPILDGVRDFRLMTRQVVDSILELGEVNRFSKGIFSWVGYETTYISYDNRERQHGKSSWTFWDLIHYSIDGFINFSEMPLTIATWTGTISFVLSIFAIIFIVIRKLLFGDPVSGWASTVSIILFIGGIQLFCMGIIGKYMSKIFLETKKRPIYIIKEKR